MKNALCHFAVVMCLGVTPSLGAEAITGKARVIDGDTIDVGGQRVRLHGIDAPEKNQKCKKDGKVYPCGKEATEALAKKVKDRDVTCEGQGTDKYGRTIGRCKSGRTDLGGSQVKQGEALAYRKYSNDYVDEEKKAKKEHRGVWKGKVEKPWDYRSKPKEKKIKPDGEKKK